jgi:hypothetical protein
MKLKRSQTIKRMRNVTEMKIKWEDTFFFLGQHTSRGHEREKRGERKSSTVAKSSRTTIHTLAQ